MKLAFLISAAAWLIAAAYRWATRPHHPPEMTSDQARRIVRQQGRRADKYDKPPDSFIAPPVDFTLFKRD